MTTPQEIAEAALAASSADGCVVITAEHTETNLRWAANALTTNGQMRTRSVTVISTFDRRGGTSAGVVTRSVSTLEEVADVVRAAERAGREAEPADDASPLVEDYPHDDEWDAAPAETGVAVFDHFAPALGAQLRRWRGRRPAAVRLRRAPDDLVLPRHLDRRAAPLRPARRPPRGQRQVGRPHRARRGTGGTPRTSPTSTSTRSRPGWNSGSTGPGRRSNCPPDGTRRSCRRPPSPT